jgi:hypothetical protein
MEMTVSWGELSSSFGNLAAEIDDPDFAGSLDAISGLCSWLASQKELSKALYGYSSLHTLFITQTPPHFPLHPSIQQLMVEPDKAGGIVFKFIDTNIEEKRWSRRATDASSAIARLKGFLAQVGWV